MPRRKKISTPGKKPGSSNTTYEEGEEMQHDMAKLRDQVQQVSLAQKGTEAKHGRIKEVTTRKGH